MSGSSRHKPCRQSNLDGAELKFKLDGLYDCGTMHLRDLSRAGGWVWRLPRFDKLELCRSDESGLTSQRHSIYGCQRRRLDGLLHR